MGINAVKFDLHCEDTWSNLPPKSNVEATIFTFEILATELDQLKRLWETCIATDRPVLCLSTSSVFQAGDFESIVNESAPLTGLSVTGNRVKAEEWVLANGATVLHLSGIVGDEEEKMVGPSRSIKSFLTKGYFKNGLKAVNLVHVNDIYKISMIVIEKLQQCSIKQDVPSSIRGQRILVSCGAFRIKDFTEALKMDSLPEIPPPDSTMKGSKIISIEKLLTFLPVDYEWTLPVAGVEPVSRGLPTTGPQDTDADGAAHDRQWALMRLNFRGKWQGKSTWYEKDKGKENGGNLEHQAFIAEMNAAFPIPVVTIENTQYHIYFLDADNGIWHGTGLRFAPNGEKVFPISRKKYNQAGTSFCFEGAGGKCSVHTSLKFFGVEISFLYKRSRSMIISRYALDSASNKLLLDLVGIVPFRCSLNIGQCDFPLKPPQSKVRGSISDLLQSLQGMTCRKQWRSYLHALDEANGELCEYPTDSIQLFSNPERVVQLFDDDLVCSIPTDIQVGQRCELVFGCFHASNFVQIATLTYDQNGNIDRYTLEKWI